MRQLFVLALLAATIAAPANAWWCTGHMTVAQIAKNTMSSSAVSAVEEIVSNLSQEGPFPKTPDFMQVACWADDLKSLGLDAMATWHFFNQPYNPQNIPIVNPEQEENVVSVIMQLDKAAKSNKDNKQGWILGFAVANLIHFYGDIHQPLHVTDMFSTTYPNGDRGGNEETVYVDGTQTKLHFIWDSICWEYNQELNRPLSSSDAATVTNLAQRLMNTYSFTDAQKKEYNSTVMAIEGFNDAVQYAYPGVYSGMTITQDYLNACIPVAEARVALAGYRLGSQLEYMLGNYGHDADLFAKKVLEHITVGTADVARATAQGAAALRARNARK